MTHRYTAQDVATIRNAIKLAQAARDESTALGHTSDAAWAIDQLLAAEDLLRKALASQEVR